MSCAVPGCLNNQRNCKKTFFSLPKIEENAKAWIKRLNRKDTLPKKVLVCEDHFTVDCFDSINELKIRFQEQSKKKIPRVLVHNAIPSIFPRISAIPSTKQRTAVLKLKKQRIVEELLDQAEAVTNDECDEPLAYYQSIAIQANQPVDDKGVQACILPRVRSRSTQITTVLTTPRPKSSSIGIQCNLDTRPLTVSVATQSDKYEEAEEIISVENLASTPIRNHESDKSFNDSWLEASAKCELSDPDFELEDEVEDEKQSLHLTLNPAKINPMVQPVYLVYESCLEQLMSHCPRCKQPVLQIASKKVYGTQVCYQLSCLSGCDAKWCSQPVIVACKGVGNLAVTAAVDLACIPFPKIKRFAFILNMPFIEKTSYYRLRGDYVFPEINAYYEDHQHKLLSSIESPVELAIDGQCDSPGYNATYCTVSAMDLNTEKILQFNIVDVKEVKNSQGMELEGFIRCVDNLENNVDIKMISTDRHIQIKKKMKSDRYRHIKHQFDPRHIAKGISKKLTQASKKKGFAILGQWVPAVVNHLYWSLQTAEGNGEELVERFLSVIHHVTNRHEFIGNIYYKECAHAYYTKEDARSREWMKQRSPPHELLKKVILQSQLVKDMKKMSQNASTSALEIFHALKIRYLPKSIFYEKEKMIAATKVAVLDHNLNADRGQATTLKEGKYVPRFKLAWNKRSKKFSASKVKTKKDYSFMREIANNAYFRAVDGNKAKTHERQNNKRKLFVRPSERPDRDEIIENSIKYSRLQKIEK